MAATASTSGSCAERGLSDLAFVNLVFVGRWLAVMLIYRSPPLLFPAGVACMLYLVPCARQRRASESARDARQATD